MIQRSVIGCAHNPKSMLACPRCGSLNTDHHEQYYCTVCNKCGSVFKFL